MTPVSWLCQNFGSISKMKETKKKKHSHFICGSIIFFLSATDLHRLKQKSIYCFKLDLEITQKHTETKVYVFSLLQVHRKGFDS